MFPQLGKSKLQQIAGGPFTILERINDDAYKIYLLSEYGISSSININDLSLCNVGTLPPNSMSNSFQEGRDDGGPYEDSREKGEGLESILQKLQGPITRAMTSSNDNQDAQGLRKAKLDQLEFP